ncbi:MAG: DNA repair protein RadC [Methanomicrobiales archaeon]|nr:DNA repair protein RadC [Methanomicrobiales archaeon]
MVTRKRMKEIPAIDRPREKLLARGAGTLTDQELVAAIIGKGVKGRDVVTIAEDVVAFLTRRPGELDTTALAAVAGMGKVKAVQIVAGFELARRFLRRDTHKRVTTPEDVLALVSFLQDRPQEHFICISLNGAGEVIGQRTVTIGLLNHSLVHPREVFADAITDRAASIICVHNHPSGSLEPSREDISVTHQLRDAGEILGIRLLDHIIIAGGRFCSLKERGLLN